MGKLAIGIDIGGMSIKLGVVDKEGKVLRTSSFPVSSKIPQDKIPGMMEEAISSLLKDSGLKASVLSGIGIGCPGAIDSGKGVCDYSNNLGWKGLALTSPLAKFFSLPVKITNDANAAALGEARFGAGKGVKNVVLITLGTGVGGGLVLNGQLYEGKDGKGAELGHMIIKAGGRKCTCGARGCLEAYASTSALLKDARKAMQKNPSSLLYSLCNGKKENLTGRVVFEAYKEKDRTALSVLSQYFDYLTIGLINILNIFRPDVILLGGGISGQKEVLRKPLEDRLEKEHYGFGGGPKVPLKIAELGNIAGIVGAASLVL